ncbi:MAG: killer suppression protein HigA [Gammaproteobacteria bacterium]|nr:killer suppression protein HigA [Gammaproteobacteria bacterium]
MEVSFRSRRLRKLCEQRNAAERTLGRAGARKLIARLEDLQAAACVADLSAGRPHPLSGDRRGQFALDLSGGLRLVFVPDQPQADYLTEGAIDWSMVRAVRIEFIGDYHG